MSAPLVACDINLPGDSGGDASAGADEGGGTAASTTGPGPMDTGDGSGDMTTSAETGVDSNADGSGTSAAGDGSSGGSGGTGEDVGDCCSAHAEPGCTVPTIEQCVCNADDYCCDPEGAWDEGCVGLVEELECGVCTPR